MLKEGDQTLITVIFLRRNDDPDLSIEPELSEDLVGWESGPTVFQTVSITGQGNGYEQVEMKTQPASPARTFAFVRLRIIRSNP